MKCLFLTLIVVMLSIPSYSQQKPLIIAELFTSEGCSSCPPADHLLSKIVNQTYENTEVIGLSFHVDYWDYIGWKDPYAKSEYTVRQRGYGRKFQNTSIYTPQMIINGKYEFVGSNSGEWSNAYIKESGTLPKYTLTILSTSIKGEKLLVSVSADGIERSILNIAVVEKNLTQEVTRGENRGRILSHDNVVRAYAYRQFDGQRNDFEINLPQDLKKAEASLIVYAQEEKSWHVLAAEKISLSQIH